MAKRRKKSRRRGGSVRVKGHTKKVGSKRVRVKGYTRKR